MPIEALKLIGAGGHAAVVADAAWLAGVGEIALYSQDAAQAGNSVLGHPVLFLSEVVKLGGFHVAIGSNAVRRRLQEQYVSGESRAITVRHPQAVIASSSLIGAGSFIAAGAILAPRTEIGRGVIINHRAVVDHDVTVLAYSHIAPGVVLGGGVTIGQSVLVGAGATVLPGVTIGEGAVIGAGAVVLADVSAGMTVVGVPGREKGKGA